MGKKKFEYELDRMIDRYGYQFVRDAVEQAVFMKDVQEIKSKRAGIERIERMAREMGVRLG